LTFGVREIIAILLTVGGLVLIGIGVARGEVAWNVLLPVIAAWISAVISVFITARVMAARYAKKGKKTK
jgi:hypothetical membrane protein